MMRKLATTVGSVLAISAGSAQAGLITFEDLTVAGTVVTNQYQASDGVIFTSSPLIGRRGGDLEGWEYPNGTQNWDGWAGNFGDNAGDSFITDVLNNTANNGTAVLTVEYTSPVAELSFDLYDMDAAESYTIEIFSDMALTQLLETRVYAAPGSPVAGITPAGAVDGGTFRVGFTRAANEIQGLRVTGTSNGGPAFGLGFDNFNTDENAPVVPVPVPGTLLLLGSAFLGLGAARRRVNR